MKMILTAALALMFLAPALFSGPGNGAPCIYIPGSTVNDCTP